MHSTQMRVPLQGQNNNVTSTKVQLEIDENSALILDILRELAFICLV